MFFATFRTRPQLLSKCLQLRALHTPGPLIDDLKARGLVAQVTSPNLAAIASTESLSVYLGVDPTARSLHAGNLLALMSLLHFHIRGHQVITLIGGATGSIGDPGGRSTERPLLSKEALAENVASITSQAQEFLSNASKYASKRVNVSSRIPPVKVVNNQAWYEGVGVLDFLRDVGKHAKVNVMITRDSVKNRLASEQGISFTEFSYQLLQAYDFYTLNRDHDCRVQLGGSDQWGNIVSGIDLIRRLGDTSTDGEATTNAGSKETFGLTSPLLLTSSGAKFGKSAGNAVWLHPGMTSYLDFYQFFMHVTDADVIPYLRMFTLLSLEDIAEIERIHIAQPEKRLAQKRLAAEVTELVHGADAVRQAQVATNALFTPGDAAQFNIPDAGDLIAALGQDPRLKFVTADQILAVPLSKLASDFQLTKSRGDARKLITSGGFYLNNERIKTDRTIKEWDFISRRLVILRTGKDNHLVLALP